MQLTGCQNTIKWYDSNAEKYAKAISTPECVSVNDIEKFAALLSTGGKILDAGCAAGRDVNILSQRGFNVTGIDVSEGLIKIAKQNYPHLTFIKGDFLNLPFKDNSFDGVWSHAGLVHLETIEDVKKALSEFNRVLTKDGILYVKVKGQTNDKKTDVVKDSLSGGERFFRFYEDDELRELIESSGFELISFDTEADRTGRGEVKWVFTFSKKI